MQAGDKVFYHSGAIAVPAEVVAVNEDGTINLLYPHPQDASVNAGAENVYEGYGAFQWSTYEERSQDTTPAPKPSESTPTGSGELEAKLSEARSAVAQRNHTISELRKEVESLKALPSELVLAHFSDGVIASAVFALDSERKAAINAELRRLREESESGDADDDSDDDEEDNT